MNQAARWSVDPARVRAGKLLEEAWRDPAPTTPVAEIHTQGQA
jgi:hypothetical protein